MPDVKHTPAVPRGLFPAAGFVPRTSDILFGDATNETLFRQLGFGNHADMKGTYSGQAWDARAQVGDGVNRLP